MYLAGCLPYLADVAEPWARMTTRLKEQNRLHWSGDQWQGRSSIRDSLGIETSRNTTLRRIMEIPDDAEHPSCMWASMTLVFGVAISSERSPSISKATALLTIYRIGEQKQQPPGCETTQKFTW